MMNAPGMEALGPPAEATPNEPDPGAPHSNSRIRMISPLAFPVGRGLHRSAMVCRSRPSKSALLWVSFVMFPLTPFRSGQYTALATGRPDPREGGPCRPFTLRSTQRTEGEAWNEIWPWRWSG